MTRDLGQLKAAVAGTGFIGAVHVEALRRLGVEVLGVCASSQERAAAKGLAPAYESFDALLADERVDVVHVATPNHLHHAQVKAALATGKHVVCEKPLALTASESAELLALAESSGLVHCTNFNLRFYPQAYEMRATRRLRCARDDLERTRGLSPGLAPLSHRLELAARAGEGRRAARSRRHRVALARSRAVGDRSGDRGRVRRSRDDDPCAQAADR